MRPDRRPDTKGLVGRRSTVEDPLQEVRDVEFGTLEDATAAVRRLLRMTGVAYQRTSQLQRALESRVVIEQAKGMLAERFGIGVEDAFAILRRSARSNRVKLSTLCEQIVARGDLPADIRNRNV